MASMPEDENGLTNPWHGVSRAGFEHALQEMIGFSAGRNLPKGFVPETFLFLWAENEIVGQFRIRHHLCESLRNGAGTSAILSPGLSEAKAMPKKAYA